MPNWQFFDSGVQEEIIISSIKWSMPERVLLRVEFRVEQLNGPIEAPNWALPQMWGKYKRNIFLISLLIFTLQFTNKSYVSKSPRIWISLQARWLKGLM